MNIRGRRRRDSLTLLGQEHPEPDKWQQLQPGCTPSLTDSRLVSPENYRQGCIKGSRSFPLPPLGPCVPLFLPGLFELLYPKAHRFPHRRIRFNLAGMLTIVARISTEAHAVARKDRPFIAHHHLLATTHRLALLLF